MIDEEIEDFDNIVNRRPHNIQQRPNHLNYWDDIDFRIRFRISKNTFQHLLALIEENIRYPTNRNHALNPFEQLLVCLRFYATGSFLISIGDFSAIHKSTVCLITRALCLIKQDFIKFPEDQEKIAIQQGFYSIAAFPRVLLIIDGTHVRIQSPGGDQAEQFRNRKGYFSLNVMIACDHQLKIRQIVARWPGASNDINVFMNSALRARFENAANNSLILGDSGYPTTRYLLTPLLNPQNAAEMRYQESQIRTRNVIERCIGVWKRRFPCLALGLRLKLTTVQDVVVASAILHNIAVAENEPDFQVDDEIQQLIDDVVPVDNVLEDGAGYRNELINNYFAML